MKTLVKTWASVPLGALSDLRNQPTPEGAEAITGRELMPTEAS
jgi:hypothetical protein